MENPILKRKHHYLWLFLLLFLVIITSGIFMATILFKDVNSDDSLSHIAILNSTPVENTSSSEEISKEELSLSKELFSAHYDKAQKLLSTMSLEEKVGQLFLARYPKEGVIEEIKQEHPGGYLLFDPDFRIENKKSILEKLTACQEASRINLILGVDEEGGTVVRVSRYKAFRNSHFLSPQQLWERGQLSAILEDSKEKSSLLKSIGLNMNLTPVADVPTSDKDFIYKRSYGRGPEKTAIYVSELIKTMKESNMISTMKHFPGYGNNVDTHTGIAIDNRPYSTFETSDFLPFQSGIAAGAPTILVNHNIVNCMDATLPASLSPKVHQILRENLQFSGIIMTDDLAMNAVKSYVENGEAAVKAILAGNDMIITSQFKEHKREVLQALKDGTISVTIIDKAVTRILAWKYAYQIIE